MCHLCEFRITEIRFEIHLVYEVFASGPAYWTSHHVGVRFVLCWRCYRAVSGFGVHSFWGRQERPGHMLHHHGILNASGSCGYTAFSTAALTSVSVTFRDNTTTVLVGHVGQV